MTPKFAPSPPNWSDAILRAGLVAAANQQPTQAAVLFTAVTRLRLP
ncbi:MAG: hypothetical protein HC804_13545 [Anaerolineae bacterium]|nr:hypothetical protein [Anaerolineae bacterium]